MFEEYAYDDAGNSVSCRAADSGSVYECNYKQISVRWDGPMPNAFINPVAMSGAREYDGTHIPPTLPPEEIERIMSALSAGGQ